MSISPIGGAIRSRLSVTTRVFTALAVLMAIVSSYALGDLSDARTTLRHVAEIRRTADRLAGLTILEVSLANESGYRKGLAYAAGIGASPELVLQTMGVDLRGNVDKAALQVDAAVVSLGSDAPVTADVLAAHRQTPDGLDPVLATVAAAREASAKVLHGETSANSASVELHQEAADVPVATALIQQVTTQLFDLVDVMFPFSGRPLDERLTGLLISRRATTTALDELGAKDDAVGVAARQLRDAPAYVAVGRLADDQARLQLAVGGSGRSQSLAQIADLRSVWTSSAANQAMAHAIVTAATDSLAEASRRLDAETRQRVGQQVAVLLGTAVAVLVLCLWIFRSVVRPVQSLEQHARQLASGDPPDEELPVRGARELRVAASALNQLVGALRVVERQASALAAGDVDHPALAQHLPGRLGGALTGAVHRLRGSISRSNELTERLSHEANHDGLTTLANRRMVLPALERAIRRSDEHGVVVGALFIDLDQFKAVNDCHGHDAGDRVLVVVSERLRGVVRQADLIARLGGDEFLVVVENVPDLAVAVDLGERIVAAIEAPISLRDGNATTLSISASVGIAIHSPGQGADDLLSNADQAMYDAKAIGPGRVAISDPRRPAPSAAG